VVTDPMLPTLSCGPVSLAPGASTTCTQTYTVTQADINAGSIYNTASATGYFGNTPYTDTDDNTVNVTTGPSITLTKTSTPSTVTTAGQVITYTLVAQNTGNVTLTNVVVTDPMLPALSCGPVSLAPGASATCTQTYTVTQVDINAGSIYNTASATGYFGNTPYTDTDDNTVNVTTGPSITLTKTSTPTTVTTAGQVITYTLVAQNTGNVTLTNVVVTDPMLPTLSCSAVSLAPGATTTCTQTYTVTQADINAGSIYNTASATGYFGNTPYTDTDDNTVTVTQTPGITLTKTSTPTNVTTAGQVITYTLVAQNTGNVTLTNVVVTDPMLPTLSCSAATLAPGATTTCTQTYTVTQADINAGSIYNTASVTGYFNNTPYTDTDDNTVTVTQTPGITLTKTSTPSTVTTAGQVITYTLVAQNTGNVTLTNVVVTDPMLPALSCGSVTLAPGASATCTQTYTVTQADINAGSIYNTASATGYFGNTPYTDTDDNTVNVTTGPSITLTKTSTPSTVTTAGQVITYTLVAQNTGNVTLTNVVVTDPMLPTLSCGPVTLAPGASATCTQTYTVTQADINAGSIYNTASATGYFGNTPYTDTDDNTVNVTTGPSITLTKTSTPSTVTTAGQVITYTLVAQNTGNVTADRTLW
jgi:uncharacterized repeat protein (TIGR01451 family)